MVHFGTSIKETRMAYLPNDYIGKLIGANLNSTADQQVPIALRGNTKYIIRKIVVTNVSTTLAVSLVAGGLYSGASKSGVTIVAAAQVYTALTGSTKYLDLTIATGALTDILSANPVFFSLTTAHGSAATADIYVFGDLMN